MYLAFLILAFLIVVARFMAAVGVGRPARPTGRHSAGHVQAVPADHNPLTGRVRAAVAAYAIHSMADRKEWAL